MRSEIPFDAVIDFQEGPGIMARDFRDEGVPLIRLAGLTSEGQLTDGCNFLDPDMVQRKWTHFRLKEGDTLISTSASLGRIARVTKNSQGSIAYTGIIRMRPRDKRILSDFIQYLVAGSHFQRQVEAMGAGSVMRHFGPSHLRKMTVLVPPIYEQQQIVSILTALDAKIDSNQRLASLLEDTTATVFRARFVDFAGIGDLEESEIGKIPRGWRVGEICEICRLRYGKALKASDRETGAIPVVGSSGVIGQHSNSLVTGPVVVIGRKGIPGSVIWIRQDAWPIDTTFFAEAIDDIDAVFIYFFLRQADLSRLTADSAVPGLSRNAAEEQRMTIPTKDAISDFVSIADPFFRKRDFLQGESSTLVALRDALLPKLISGEIRVPDTSDPEEVIGPATEQLAQAAK